jgi:hypothetical protein
MCEAGVTSYTLVVSFEASVPKSVAPASGVKMNDFVPTPPESSLIFR